MRIRGPPSSATGSANAKPIEPGLSQFRQKATTCGPRRRVSSASGRFQLVVGDDRAEVSLHDLERLENRPLFEELAVVLRALPVVAATDILGRKMSCAIPTPAAWCRRIRVNRSCQLVMTAVTDVAKAVEMAVLRLDESKPGVPERVSPVQGLKECRVDLTSAV
jgi:hypothetical protein